jgi:uncharacterized protein with FMN-binding domain
MLLHPFHLNEPTGSTRRLRQRGAAKRMARVSKKNTAATVAGIAMSLVVTGCGMRGADVQRSASTPSAIVMRLEPTSSGGSTYRDGTYSATGQYGSLPSSIGVSVTLEDDIVTAVEVTPYATNPTSRDYQERFAEAIPALVVGRDIDEVNVSRVAGSSGTPEGFNAALQQIKERASR